MFKLGKHSVPAVVVLCALGEAPAHAYMGAGAGLSAIGSMLSFLGVMLLMVVGFVWFPLKRAIKRMTGKADTSPVVEAQAADAETEA